MSTTEKRFSHDLDRFYARKENRDVFACCRAGMRRDHVADPTKWFTVIEWRCENCRMLWKRDLSDPTAWHAIIGA